MNEAGGPRVGHADPAPPKNVGVVPQRRDKPPSTRPHLACTVGMFTSKPATDHERRMNRSNARCISTRNTQRGTALGRRPDPAGSLP